MARRGKKGGAIVSPAHANFMAGHKELTGGHGRRSTKSKSKRSHRKMRRG